MKGFRHWILGIAVLGAVAAAGAGCGKSEKDSPPELREDTPLTAEGEVREGRSLTAAEMDTLLAMKKRLHITRDEYWDDWGGILANDWAEFRYPTGKLTVGFAAHAFDAMAAARAHAREVFGEVPAQRLTVRCAESMKAYARDTKHGWWHYGALDGNTLTLQPIPVIMQRGLLGIAPAREYYRWVIRTLSGGNAPAWIEYGLASVIAREDAVLDDQTSEFGDTPVARDVRTTNKGLQQVSDRLRFRRAHYNAFRMCRRLVARGGLAGLAALVRDLGAGRSLDEASRRNLGAGWNDIVKDAATWTESESP